MALRSREDRLADSLGLEDAKFSYDDDVDECVAARVSHVSAPFTPPSPFFDLYFTFLRPFTPPPPPAPLPL